MARNRIGVVVVPEHDAGPLRGRNTTLPRVPQYKIDKNIESLLSHFTVYFDTELQTHVVPIRPRWANWFGYHRKKYKLLKVADIVLRANGKPRGNGIKLAFINGDCCDYRFCNLAAKTAWQVEKEILNKEGKQRCSVCKEVKTVDQFHARGYECKACQKERAQLRLAKKSKQTVCQTCGSVFDGEGRKRRYCSNACRLEKVKQRKLQVIGENICQVCGKSFAIHSKQRLQKYCSAKCRKKGGGHKHTCEQCGKEYFAARKTRRFCSDACRSENSRNYYECEECGKKFKTRGGKDAHRFCGRACYGRNRTKQALEKGGVSRTALSKQAVKSESIFPYSLMAYNASEKLDASLRKYLRKHLETLQAELERKQLADWLKNGPCEECGKAKGLAYSPQRLRSALHDETRTPYWCKSCLRKSRFWEFECKRCGREAASCHTKKPDFCQRCLKNRSRKKTTHKKRCARRGLPYDPAVKTFEVGNRANWCCEICKQEILRVWTVFGPDQIPHPLAPTIDHIVPLLLEDNKKHGHTWENTQLACFDCNSDKSDQCELWLTQCDDPRQAIGLKIASVFSSIS